tara:strand:+ start:27608 stop:29341 length:1734 start_codon:yes stop_codon:yes gene_type:complete
MKTLILDGDTLPALAIARSLGKQGITIDIASHAQAPIAGSSKFVDEVLHYPSPLDDTSAFLGWIEKLLNTGRYQLVMPATERTIVPLARFFDGTEFASKICMPALNALNCVLDKAETARLADECEVPQPGSWQLSTSQDLDIIVQEMTYPVVVKPGRSISEGDQRVPLTVCYAHNDDQLRKITDDLLKHAHVVLQQYFKGIGVGIELIADKGEVIYAFQHQRVHEMPLTGGGSSYRKSVEIDSDLLDASKRLIRKLVWHGVAMVEFMRGANDEYVLVEINGRFWGSLPLAVAAGADFPAMLHQLYTQGSVTTKQAYKREIYCRKLSSDLKWLEAVLRKDADPRLVKIPDRSSAFKDFAKAFRPRDHFDAQSWGDPVPGLLDLQHILSDYWRRLTGLLQERRYLRNALRDSAFTKIEEAAASSRRILYLCYGNINRSAAAHALSESEIEAGRLEFKSAGFHKMEGRPPDPRMTRIAHQHGVDMQAMRSSIVTPELVDWADLIFVMEAAQIATLEQISTNAKGKTYLLGGLCKGGAIEIPDPYNKHETVYRSVYDTIEQCITQLAQILKNRLGGASDAE